MIVLGIEFDEKESLDLHCEKLEKLLKETTKVLSSREWNVGKLQELPGCWSWLLLLAKPALLVLQKCYELADSGNKHVIKTNV